MQWICFMYPSLTVPLFIYMPVLTRRSWGGRSGYWFCLCFDDLPNEFSNCSNDDVIIACLFFVVVFFSFYYQHYILNNQFNPTTFDWSACTKQGKWPVVYLFARVSILSLSTYFYLGPSWSWSYGSWIYNYLCNQCLSPLKLWVWTRSWRGVLDTTLCNKVCQWLVTGRWFFPGTPVASTNKTDPHDITEILLKVALSTP